MLVKESNSTDALIPTSPHESTCAASERPKLLKKTASGRSRQNTSKTCLTVEEEMDENGNFFPKKDKQKKDERVAEDGSEEEVLSSKSNSSGNILEEDEETRKNLRWSTLTVREYPYIVGDNVPVMGPPISICFNHQSEDTYCLNEYEKSLGLNTEGDDDGNGENAEGAYQRRTQSELRIPSRIRKEILTSHGHTEKEIKEAISRATKTKNQRKQTVANLKMQEMEEHLEKFKKKVPLFGKKKKNNENCAVEQHKKLTSAEFTTEDAAAAASSSGDKVTKKKRNSSFNSLTSLIGGSSKKDKSKKKESKKKPARRDTM